MGVIIRAEGKKFIKDFLPNVDYKDFNYVLISQRVTQDGRHDNIKAFPALMPVPASTREFVNGNKKEAKRVYLEQLQEPNQDGLIYILVNAAINRDMNIVLVCSEFEKDFKYIKQISELIEIIYKVKVYSIKDYLKDKDKSLEPSNKDEIVKILKKKKASIQQKGININEGALEMTMEEIAANKFLAMGRKKMKKIAKENGIKFKDDVSKEKMAKKLAKKILSR